MGFVSSFVEGIAQDYALDTATDKWNEFAEKKFQTKDPYTYETPEGKSKKLKLPENATKEEQKMWKWVQRRAWVDDKCFMGCYPVDCGIGLGPILVILPAIGPFLMYAVHARMVHKAASFYKLDAKTFSKLQANILFDLIISFPPVIGSFFTWMTGCSTRNAAIIHTEVTKRLMNRKNSKMADSSGNLEKKTPPSSKGQLNPQNPHEEQRKLNPYPEITRQVPSQTKRENLTKHTPSQSKPFSNPATRSSERPLPRAPKAGSTPDNVDSPYSQQSPQPPAKFPAQYTYTDRYRQSNDVRKPPPVRRPPFENKEQLPPPVPDRDIPDELYYPVKARPLNEVEHNPHEFYPVEYEQDVNIQGQYPIYSNRKFV